MTEFIYVAGVAIILVYSIVCVRINAIELGYELRCLQEVKHGHYLNIGHDWKKELRSAKHGDFQDER